MGAKMCSELELSRNCARVTSDHKRDSAELNRLLNDEKIASDQDIFVGLDGIEPSASALSVLVGGTRVNGWVLAGTLPGREERASTGVNGLARAMDARCSVPNRLEDSSGTRRTTIRFAHYPLS